MYIYIIKERFRWHYKIGISNNVVGRLSALQTGNPRKLTVVGAYKVKSRRQAHRVETQLHRYLRIGNLKNEWFFLPYPLILIVRLVIRWEII
jgi:predicted GIY-YIG superfamily endonuclease